MQPPPSNPSAAALTAATGGALARRKLAPKPMTNPVGNMPGGAADQVVRSLPATPLGPVSDDAMAQMKAGPAVPQIGGDPSADFAKRYTSAMPSGMPGSDADRMPSGAPDADMIAKKLTGLPGFRVGGQPQQVQGRDLNEDGASITGRGGNVQQLGAAAMRRLGGGGAGGFVPPDLGGSGSDGVMRRIPTRSPVRGTAPEGDAGAGGPSARPRGLKGFRMPPGFDPSSIITLAGSGPALPGGPREPDFLSNPPAGPKPMVADEQPLGQPIRPGGGARFGRRVQGY